MWHSMGSIIRTHIEAEICTAITLLKRHKARGPDGLPIVIFKDVRSLTGCAANQCRHALLQLKYFLIQLRETLVLADWQLQNTPFRRC